MPPVSPRLHACSASPELDTSVRLEGNTCSTSPEPMIYLRIPSAPPPPPMTSAYPRLATRAPRQTPHRRPGARVRRTLPPCLQRAYPQRLPPPTPPHPFRVPPALDPSAYLQRASSARSLTRPSSARCLTHTSSASYLRIPSVRPQRSM